MPYDVCFPITPKEYLSRKETRHYITRHRNIGDQGTDTEYLFSEYHFWTLTSNAVSTFARKMALYMSMKSILDEDSKIWWSETSQEIFRSNYKLIQIGEIAKKTIEEEVHLRR